MTQVTNIAEAVRAAWRPVQQHAKLSPSGAKRWMTCTASPEHNANSDEGSNEYADEGTAAHTLASFTLEEGRMCADYLGQVIPVLNDADGTTRREFKVDHDMAMYVQVYVDSIRDKVHEGAHLFVEKRVHTGLVSEKYGEVDGTADAIVIDYEHGILDVNDLKYGKGITVDAATPVASIDHAVGPCVRLNGVYYELNPQLALYAVGAFMDYGWMAQLPTVRIGVHQPRLDHYTIAEIPTTELLAWAEGHVKSVLNYIDRNPQYYPTTEGCRWCALAGQCEAQEQFVNRTVRDDFADISGTMDNSRVAAAKEHLEFVEQWCNQVKAKAAELAAKGQLPGWKRVVGRAGNRAWSDEEAVEQMFKDVWRLTNAEAFKPATLISPAEAQKKFEKAHPSRWEKLQAYIKRGNPSYEIVRNEDPRPPVTVADDFKVIK